MDACLRACVLLSVLDKWLKLFLQFDSGFAATCLVCSVLFLPVTRYTYNAPKLTQCVMIFTRFHSNS